uniref:Histone H2A/H2B/H3 domain-containing protein n=1 Tax=Capra hircus TaxID=9925 RepID=A0A8C2S8P1_CAPHI
MFKVLSGIREAGAPRAPLHRPPAGLFLGTNSRPPARPRHGILKEGRALQKTTHLPLRKTPFCRLAREICVQTFLVHFFQDAYLLALHAGRVALPEGCAAGARIRGIQEGLG